jgi:hypothetical protein
MVKKKVAINFPILNGYLHRRNTITVVFSCLRSGSIQTFTEPTQAEPLLQELLPSEASTSQMLIFIFRTRNLYNWLDL